ncbi:MAG: hypothetical protein VCE75_06910 [Alphaproteobacteria bacterium]
MLAVNFTNAHLDLSPVVRNLAKAFGKNAPDLFSRRSSQWVLVTSNRRFLNDNRVRKHITPRQNEPPKPFYGLTTTAT